MLYSKDSNFTQKVTKSRDTQFTIHKHIFHENIKPQKAQDVPNAYQDRGQHN